MKNFINCECKNWASDNRPPLTNHHRRCPEYNCEKESVELVKLLVQGIENDAADTDGISDHLYEHYKRALCYLGEFGKLKKCLEQENYGQVPISTEEPVFKPDGPFAAYLKDEFAYNEMMLRHDVARNAYYDPKQEWRS